MDNIAKTFESLVNRAKVGVSRSGEDYIDPADGLLYCGKCRTPKQCRVKAFGKDYTPYCACQCEQVRLEKEREDFAQSQREVDLNKLRTSSGMSPKLRDCRFEDYKVTADNDAAYKTCIKYADSFDIMLAKNQGLLLWGGMGTGKTFSAACIANALLDKGVSVIMTSFVRLLGMSNGFDIDGDMLGFLFGEDKPADKPNPTGMTAQLGARHDAPAGNSGAETLGAALKEHYNV